MTATSRKEKAMPQAAPKQDSPASAPAQGARVPCEHRTFIPEIVKIDTENRRVTHKISDSTLDRMNDVIESDAWDVRDFRKNPVVLADHRYSIANIIGKAVDVKTQRNGLFATTEFDGEGLGAQAFGLVQRGLAKAWSVGFKTVEAHSVNEGIRAKCKRCKAMKNQIIGTRDPDEVTYVWGTHFTKVKLVEYSLVAVPANPNVVMGMLAKGYIDEENIDKLLVPWQQPREEFLRGANTERQETMFRQREAVQEMLAKLEDSLSTRIVEMGEAVVEALHPALVQKGIVEGPDKDALDEPPDDDKVASDPPEKGDEGEAPPGASESTDAEPPEPTFKANQSERVDAMTRVRAALRKKARGMAIKAAATRRN